jgi:hypothetical protein
MTFDLYRVEHLGELPGEFVAPVARGVRNESATIFPQQNRPLPPEFVAPVVSGVRNAMQ